MKPMIQYFFKLYISGTKHTHTRMHYICMYIYMMYSIQFFLTVAGRMRPRAVRERHEAGGVIDNERHLRDAPDLSRRRASIKEETKVKIERGTTYLINLGYFEKVIFRISWVV